MLASSSLTHLGFYFSGDGALRDEDGDYRITGRVDDMINSKGHIIGTAELECAMVNPMYLTFVNFVTAFSITGLMISVLDCCCLLYKIGCNVKLLTCKILFTSALVCI